MNFNIVIEDYEQQYNLVYIITPYNHLLDERDTIKHKNCVHSFINMTLGKFILTRRTFVQDGEMITQVVVHK